MSRRYMIHIKGTVYANELYAYPSIAGNHIFDFNKAKQRAAELFSDSEYCVYNGENSFTTVGYDD